MDQFHIREHLKSQFPYPRVSKLVANGINYPGRTKDSLLVDDMEHKKLVYGESIVYQVTGLIDTFVRDNNGVVPGEVLRTAAY